MRRICAMLTMVWFLAMGTGSVEFLHNAQHALEDARRGHEGSPAPIHDESNCRIHAQLHQPLIAQSAVLLLVSIAPVFEIVGPPAPQFTPARVPARIDCRGPPAPL